jgi:hypothetical protein
MADGTLRLELGAAAIPLSKLADAADSFSHLVADVTKELHPDAPAVEWTVEVERGSVVLAAKPDLGHEDARTTVNTIVSGLSVIEKGPEQPAYFTDRALEYARKLAELASDDFPVRVRNGRLQAKLTYRSVRNVNDLTVGAQPRIGTIEGRLEELNIHGKPTFQIWERLTGRKVQCRAGDSVSREQLEAAMGHRVAARGMIRASKQGASRSIDAKQLRVFPAEHELPSADEVRGILKAS